MPASCADPASLEGIAWLMCYLTSGKHLLFYASFGTVLLLLAITAPIALLLGYGGAMASRSGFAPLRWFGKVYTSMVRGVPDIVFFLFVPIALDQAFEWTRHQFLCDSDAPVRQGNDFIVCAAAKLPLSSSPAWVHDLYGIFLAVIAFSVVFGAFAANVLYGAMQAVPRAQLETAEAYGMSPRQVTRRVLVPQMWTYALPGLSNLWMILIKATPLLFLLGVEDIVYWARELGGAKTSAFAYPHPDWRLYYFLAILVFYLFMTWISERALRRLSRNLSAGQATMAGERLRKGAAA
ncbi:amino acid ABC transporter membrane protein 1, PAAT family [Paracoccus alcaliphilus]|mgnify:CR=1 FL=1|uniref:Amino acid ABC transporter membrane protein 1, PAAT family n=1 Tax=Paracoccus alcaliphilus TaxID=34002 RepID=A0A1H8M876_9RHOB|nr:ABC transporter permease subunit [Paracoccus alcaliphilus]WCR16975.1 ABC transporter permease subunit [Paracoccus alcaliphilus]SEO13535.1 amino acid ABC transporter membrane protein 1, PAAT family [Paracoccus alcaliphilus]